MERSVALYAILAYVSVGQILAIGVLCIPKGRPRLTLAVKCSVFMGFLWPLFLYSAISSVCREAKAEKGD